MRKYYICTIFYFVYYQGNICYNKVLVTKLMEKGAGQKEREKDIESGRSGRERERELEREIKRVEGVGERGMKVDRIYPIQEERSKNPIFPAGYPTKFP